MSDEGMALHVPIAAAAEDRAAQTFALVERWVFSEPMAELLDVFGERMPDGDATWDKTTVDLASWLHLNEELPRWLDPLFEAHGAEITGLSAAQTDVLRRTLMVERMSADNFNFRAGANGQYLERYQALSVNFDAKLRERVLKLTDQLGLVTPRPPRSSQYEQTLVLGGGYSSPLLRARYAAQLQAKGVGVGRLAFLGSPRQLLDDPPEREKTESYAPGARDEFGLMVGAARAEFDARPGDVVLLCGCFVTNKPCPKWRFADHDKASETPPEYTHERKVELFDSSCATVGLALSPSTSRPPYRPDTSDTFGLWTRLTDPQPAERTLVVTSQVFVPFQTFDGFRRLYLPHGLDVDAVGFGTEWGDRPHTAEFLLQETLSGIRSARRLLIAAAVVLGAQ